ncbi:DUF362 domain-containing protein [Candidatus Woesearchaeota archaeon]|mgnify:CR=1 FL=1|jgi:uncharacterized protein|nr:DUF362 domain-containing protein [Candidatus Woesearchaeota archaeon]MBT3537164.1 DUF362 domain-containing protein [Candidatus Woesearchaeota archaeon]MBT4696690.1 DUF362 domain-containing protein [Candidatus Woesearchaeota archaeon]MBT7106526.1 DUF362 domain-containing protein [Candidatus Woesearchaeota archaeon]MBT7931099.1 DUF362 domain-containing protein [Candidatus Woesearchaeota archaeon]
MGKVRFIKDFAETANEARTQFASCFFKGDKVAIKMHMGEKGNLHYLRPKDVKPFVDVLKDLGAEPFLFDSIVIYSGGRDTVEKYLKTAEEHGYTEEAIGCPIVVSDDFVEVETQDMKFQVCKPLTGADGVLVLSHVKGHPCAGFGGAIKNLSMGGATKKSKGDMHNGCKPNLTGKCTVCGTCEKLCPAKSCTVKSGNFVNDENACWGCSICIVQCPERALSPKVALFDDLLAQGAYATVKASKKVFCVNVIKNVSKYCDCQAGENPIVAKDVGVLFSADPVSIDNASVDLLDKAEGRDLFNDENHKDPKLQLGYSQDYGIGTLEYELI